MTQASQVQRLIIAFKPKEIVLHALCRTQDGLNLGTKARTREVAELTRADLRDALEALEEGAECVGTSRFTMREDILLITTSPKAVQQAKGA